jgi:hypothetical protein
MKIKNLALNLPIYFLYIFGSCILVMLAEALLVSVIDKFVDLPYSVLTIIRIVIYTPGVTAILAVLGYYEGYREGVCPLGETIGGGILATVLHLLFAMLFKFQGFVSGGVRFTAGLLHNGMDITYESLINKTPYGLFLLVFVGYAAVYLVALTVAKYFGAQKRVMDRADLRKSEISE